MSSELTKKQIDMLKRLRQGQLKYEQLKDMDKLEADKLEKLGLVESFEVSKTPYIEIFPPLEMFTPILSREERGENWEWKLKLTNKGKKLIEAMA